MPKPISAQFNELADLIDAVQIDDDTVEIGLSRRDREMVVHALKAASALRLLKEMHDQHLEEILPDPATPE